ncbi:hypothetical protein [Lactococcus sp. NH2-7C]|uniref:hypothetical protein n=1 Tax=Lactococcus sp. NH2-7C TaxID=2879149 RepID=UPI001CDCF384|nr:hypothetical protein [Lactococcus sp. NH2-7C]MCA2391255.1 hypothetical protein [Lactococcus sp. NH2-7C]WGV30397.1 hypothetical protein QJV49_12990 [Lactococcus sp. NH2-7C]WGV31360.1 hypothetical protein QJV49_04990 [Lactococcus sp. NH2-7C]
MSEPSGYLLHGTAFSSKEAAFEILVHNHEQELRFHKLWDEDAQPYYFAQPQLTIPKSIADELEKYDFELTSKGLMYRNMGGTLVEFSRVTYDEIPQLIVQTIAGNYRIVFAYLAGKAIGVDLVKVVEG